jgi:hypothetical protein
MAAIAGLHVNMSLIEALRPEDLSEAHAAMGMEFAGGVWRFRSDECDDELLRRIEAEGNLPLSKSLLVS